MKNKLAKITLFSLVAAALVAMPAASRAADSTNSPAASAPASKKHSLPFKGTAAAVDTVAATITVGQLTLNITSETKITKNGQPATMSDITTGASVTGAYKKDEAGKLNAITIKVSDKKKKKAAAQ